MMFESMRDIGKYFPIWKPSVIFDIGANIGQSAGGFRSLYADATIHSFEPVPETFSVLTEKWKEDDKIYTINKAMGNFAGSVKMQAKGTNTGNKVVKASASGEQFIEVPVSTIDLYVEENNIPQVDYLKIDAEGYDLQVLAGGVKFLSSHRATFVQVECGLSPDNQLHVPLHMVTGFLYPLGYRMLGVYDVGRRYRYAVPRFSADFANVVFFPEVPTVPPGLSTAAQGDWGGRSRIPKAP